MTVYAITDTKTGRTGIAPTYLHTTQIFLLIDSDLFLGLAYKSDLFLR